MYVVRKYPQGWTLAEALLHELARRQPYTKTQMAKDLGTSTPQVDRLLYNDQLPTRSPALIQRIRVWLGVSTDEYSVLASATWLRQAQRAAKKRST